MRSEIFFYLVFLSQIVLLSYFLPRRMVNRINYIFETYPAAEFPRFYPLPVKWYRQQLKNILRISWVVLVLGIVLLAATIADATNDDYAGIVFAYFLLQSIPVMLLEVGVLKHSQMMQAKDSRRTRQADLTPRRISDVISPGMLSLVALVYLGFVYFIMYVQQFDFSWFGGYTNIVGITAVNLVFAIMVAWRLYGKNRDPYQASVDRIREVRLLANQLAFISIAATLFITLTISLKMWDLHNLTQIAMSLYFQLIAFASMKVMQVDEIDFDVYRDDALPI